MKYSYVLHTPEKDIDIGDLNTEKKIEISPFCVSVNCMQKDKYELIELTVSSETEKEVYFSLMGEGDAVLYSYNGICENERIFRQSPHDPENYYFKMEKSAIPMVAAVTERGADIFISDNPSFFDNATTQHMIPEKNKFYLSSGDKGGAPNNKESDIFGAIYHKINKEHSHTFRFIAFRAEVKSLKGIRKEAFRAIEKVWGEGSNSLYRALCFACNYMHIRKNETGTSDKWVVAGIEYSNTQYFRDAFYQAWILDEYMQEQCYRALGYEFVNAENPMVYLIWSYRIVKSGKSFDKKKAEQALETVVQCMNKFYADGGYYPNCRKGGDFRNWYDTCAFALDDVDAYNQGLLVCALEAAKRLGFDIGDKKERALARYHALFNGKYIPLSAKKQGLSVDIAVGEVIYYILFDELFIDGKMFEMTYRRICDGPSKTPYGIKVVSAEDGSYLPLKFFSNQDYVNEGMAGMDVGRYQFGGSWHLYEMLFHIAGYLHGMPDAEANLTERLIIDLNYNGTTYEYMHTVKGNGVKANQGWNAAIWAIWNELIKRGKATDAFFRAADAKLETME